MNDQFEYLEILRLIGEMEKLAEKIMVASESFPAIDRNIKRINASLLMIKLNLAE